MSIDYVHGPLADTITRFSGNHSQVDNFKVGPTDKIKTFIGNFKGGGRGRAGNICRGHVSVLFCQPFTLDYKLNFKLVEI